MTNTLAGSISRMQNAQECPRGALARALRLESPGPKPDYLLVGSVHHERTAIRLETCEWPTASEIEGWHPGLDSDLAYLERRTEEVIEQINLAACTDIEIERKIAFKEDWTECAWDDPDVYWRAIADLAYTDADGVRHVDDWKTGRKVLKGVPDAMAFQIRSYGIDPMLKGCDPIVGAVHQVRGGTFGTRKVSMHSEEVADTMVAIEGWMRWWRSRPADDPLAWPATPCRLCSDCAFAPDCPELQGTLEGSFDVPETPEQVVEMALTMEAHAKLAEKLDALLREATERIGPVPLPTGKTIGHFPQDSRVIDDPEGALRELEERGADPEAIHRTLAGGLTKTMLEKDLAKLAKWPARRKKIELEALIERHSHVETSTRFTQVPTEKAPKEEK